jgi:hypothetical protein
LWFEFVLVDAHFITLMCGVEYLCCAVGLGWGVGIALGSEYIGMFMGAWCTTGGKADGIECMLLFECADINPEFLEGKTHRPNVIKQVQYAIKRVFNA